MHCTKPKVKVENIYSQMAFKKESRICIESDIINPGQAYITPEQVELLYNIGLKLN